MAGVKKLVPQTIYNFLTSEKAKILFGKLKMKNRRNDANGN